MSDDPKEMLIEQAVSAYRERTALGRILPCPAWLDLPPESREELFAKQLQSRILEQAFSPDGMTTTAKSVLSRLSSG